MQYQYIVVKTDDNGEVESIGRFNQGVGEIWEDGDWKAAGILQSLQNDGLTEEISEAVAQKLINSRTRKIQRAA